jgi:hypothetical protein
MKPMRIMLTVSVLAIGVALASCADFDPEKLDVFGLTKKKPLPGERKDVFPQGVPGVSQGVPPELTRGYQPPEQQADPAEAAAAKAAQEEAAAEKPKPKPKPKKVAAKPRPQPSTQQAVAPQQQQPSQAQSNQGPWPSQQPAQQPQSANAPWPAQQPTQAWPTSH